MKGKQLIMFLACLIAFSCHKRDEYSSMVKSGDVTHLLLDSIAPIVDSIPFSDTTPIVPTDTVQPGIQYLDRIYNTNDSSSTDRFVWPYYDFAAQMCNAESAGTSGCIFDETDLNGDGKKDFPGINKNKLVLSSTNGVIDLLASLQQGAFGIDLPSNGQKKDFTFYYRLDDGGKKTLKKITVRLFFYNTMEDIPDVIIREVKKRREEYFTVTATNPSSSPSASMTLTTTYKPKRPPLLVIVSSK
jgi:hypothetical protein